MDIDGAAQTKTIKFKELAYSVETGEAEMIGVDFVARGGGNATAVNGAPAAAPKAEGSKAVEVKGKTKLGEKKEKQKEEAVIDEIAVLTADDEESKFASTEELIPSEAHRWQILSVAKRNELALQRHIWQPLQYFARLT
jgi:hypothetical protein